MDICFFLFHLFLFPSTHVDRIQVIILDSMVSHNQAPLHPLHKIISRFLCFFFQRKLIFISLESTLSLTRSKLPINNLFLPYFLQKAPHQVARYCFHITLSRLTEYLKALKIKSKNPIKSNKIQLSKLPGISSNSFNTSAF